MESYVLLQGSCTRKGTQAEQLGAATGMDALYTVFIKNYEILCHG